MTTQSDPSMLDDVSSLQLYLVGHGLAHPNEHVQVVTLGGGISNKIVKVITPKGAFVIKQAQAKLRVTVDWFASIDRVLIEADCMSELYGLLPPGTVPEVYFIDRERYLYAMECAPEGSILWKAELLKGSIDLDVAQLVGEILGTMHASTANNSRLAAKFRDNHILHDLRLDPCLAYLVGIYPELAPQVTAQIEQLDSVKLCLVHGDYTPKNILRCGPRLILLDYEIAHWGNPALDSAFLIAHLLLKAIQVPQWAERYVSACRAFWAAYTRSCQGFWPDDLEDATAHLVPFLVLARIDSKSPVEYITADERKGAARKLALRYIVHPASQLEEIYAHCLDGAHSAPAPEKVKEVLDVEDSD